MRTLAVDTGNKAMKTPLVVFPAGLVRHGNTKPPESDGSGELLAFQNEYYSLSSIRSPYRYDKTEDDYYRSLTLFSMAKHILATVPPAPEYRMDVALSMGLPPLHKNALQDKYKEHFSFGGKEIEFLYNDIPFQLRVRHVYVWIQGFAAIVPYFSELAQYPNVIIIDIGGFTTDIMVLNRGQIEPALIDTIDEVGVIHFFNDVIKDVKAQTNIPLNDSIIEAVLDGSYPLDGDYAMSKVAGIIARRRDQYASDLIRTFKERKYDLMAYYPVFTGGGSLLFEQSLRKALTGKSMRFIDDIRANSIGYERLANAARKKKAG